jgi:hypothetical protein
MNNYYVYMLVNPFTNKPFYVGKGQILDYCGREYRRLSDHLKLIDTQIKFYWMVCFCGRSYKTTLMLESANLVKADL